VSTSPIPAPSAQEEEQASSLPRPWSTDDTIVVLFALLGLVGGVILPVLLPSAPPITTSFLLATGLAALTYRFLGGIQASSVTVGALKLGGSLAALVGVAMLINQNMVNQINQTAQTELDKANQKIKLQQLQQQAAQLQRAYEVKGFVNDERGQPALLSQRNFSLSPENFYYDPSGGQFRISFTTGTDLDLQKTFPTLNICDGSLSKSIDLDPAATKNVVPMNRAGAEIDVGTIQLLRQGGQGCPTSAQ
jgi:hypothetical protein